MPTKNKKKAMGRPPVAEKDRKTATTFMLTRQDRGLFRKIAKATGLANRSAALRLLAEFLRQPGTQDKLEEFIRDHDQS